MSKTLLLLDQEEHTLFENEAISQPNVQIFFTTEWDSLIQDSYKRILPEADLLFLDQIYNSTCDVINYDKGIDSLFVDNAFFAALDDVFATSQEYHCSRHSRFSIKEPDPAVSRVKASKVYRFFKQEFSFGRYNKIISPNKHGWIRTLVILIGWNFNIPVYAFRHSHHSEFYLIEQSNSSNLIWLDCDYNKVCEYDSKLFSITNSIAKGAHSISSACNSKSLMVGRRSSEEKKNQSLDFPLVGLIHSITKSRIKTLKWLARRTIQRYPQNIKSLARTLNSYEHILCLWKEYVHHSFAIFFSIISIPVNFCGLYTLRYILNQKRRAYGVLALHFFPETSTLGEFTRYKHERQIATLLNKIGDSSSRIFIFEHPAMTLTGERNYQSLKTLVSLPRTYWVNTLGLKGIPHNVLSSSSFVVTLGGTIALEASYLRKVAYIFMPTPYMCCNGVYYYDQNLNRFITSEHSCDPQDYAYKSETSGFTPNDFSTVFQQLAQFHG